MTNQITVIYKNEVDSTQITLSPQFTNLCAVSQIDCLKDAALGLIALYNEALKKMQSDKTLDGMDLREIVKKINKKIQ
jgi:hypothetical protein